MNTKITAKDFFLHLGVIVTFYASVIALITLLFQVINYAYPKITNAYQYYNPSISLQVATLIVGFPLFLFLSWLLQKSYVQDPGLKDASLRKWLSYITIFIAGAVLAGDLVTVIYMFLDGQDLTTAFLFKVLTLLVVMSGVFVYYFREIRNKINSYERNIWRIISVVVILGSIVLGFMVVGSPSSQRERRYDTQRITDLQNIQWQIINYYQRKAGLPDKLSEIEDSISGFSSPVDPKTGQPYEYTLIGQSAKAFELCATFDTAGVSNSGFYEPVPLKGPNGTPANNWQHDAGRTCFTRTIDPDLYPTTKNLR